MAERTKGTAKQFLWVMAFALSGMALISQCSLPSKEELRERADARLERERIKSHRAPLIGVRFEGILVESKKRQIAKEGWGDKWPLTVDEATLVCVPQFSDVNGGVFLVADGKAFSVTGSTSTLVKARRGEVVVDGKAQRPVLFSGDDPHSDRLWAKPPPGPDGEPSFGRLNIGPIIDAGSATCES